MIEKKIRLGNLFVFYGQLLTEKQQDILKFYYINDLSLGEISEILDISRQAVYDTIKRTEKTLEEYEEKLRLLDKFLKTRDSISSLIDSINILIDNFDTESDHLLVLNEIHRIKKKALDILEES